MCVQEGVDVHTNRNTTEARGIRAPKSAVLNLGSQTALKVE